MGLRPSAAPGEVGLTRRGLFFSPGVKHVDLLLIDGGMIVIKMQAGVREPLRAVLSLWEEEGIEALFCSHSKKNILLPSLPSSDGRCDLEERVWISLSLQESGHRSTGLQVETQPRLSILMGEGVGSRWGTASYQLSYTPQGLKSFCLWRDCSREHLTPLLPAISAFSSNKHDKGCKELLGGMNLMI